MPDADVAAPAGPSRGGALFWCAAAAIVALGFLLRAAYYERDYAHPDERVTIAVVGRLRATGDWDTNWIKADVAPDMRYDQYNFSSHHYATYLFYRLVKLIPGTGPWRSAADGRHVYRFFVVLLSSLAVWQTIRLARRAGARDRMETGGEATALAAGAFTAVSTLLVQDAHYARPEAFTTVLTLAAVASCWPRPRLRPAAIVLAGFCLGVLIACKISMLLIAWLPLVPLVAAWRMSPAVPARPTQDGAGDPPASTRGDPARASTKPAGGNPIIGIAVLAGVAMAAGFALGVPGAWQHPAAFANGIHALMTQYASGHPPHGHAGGVVVADLVARYFGVTLGWPLLGCAALGAVLLGRRRRWAELALLAGPVVLFAGYFATRAVFFERNLSHVVPLACVLAAMGVLALARAINRRVPLPLPVAATVLVGLLVMQPLRFTVPLVRTEFSGRGAEAQDRFDAALRAAHPAAEWHEEPLVGGNVAQWLAAHFQHAPQCVLLRVTDYADDWSARLLADLKARFDLREVADSPSKFEGVPVCTLLTYHSAHERYFIVLGPK